MKITKAMVLCAGYGKRLHPLTLSTPKPLLKIGSKTLLSNTLNFLKRFGIKQITINVHYLGDQIIDYINRNKFHMSIRTIYEKNKILDTGGGVFNALSHFLNEPFIVINPDTIWNLNHLVELKAMEKEFFLNKRSKCFLHVVNKKKCFDKSFLGDFNLKNSLIYRKENENLKYIYTGVQILKPEVFNHLNLKVFSINKIWDELIQHKVLFGKESKVNFFHVSTLDIYKNLLKKYFKH